MDLTDRQKKIAQFLQDNIPLISHPFRVMEETDGIPESEIIDAIKHWKEEEVIRKVGALLRHRELGFTGNAMVVWAVPDERCTEVGNRFAAFREVTHCYQRTPAFEGKYNLFTMIHLKDSLFDKLLEKMAAAVSIPYYVVLESLAELKKTSMEYF